MIVLGDTEPAMRGPRPREIRREDVSISNLLEGVTSEHPFVLITVPATSVMVALDTAPHRVTTISIYYECDPSDTRIVTLELHPVGVDDAVPELTKLLGHFWYGAQLVAVYAKQVQS